MKQNPYNGINQFDLINGLVRLSDFKPEKIVYNPLYKAAVFIKDLTEAKILLDLGNKPENEKETILIITGFIEKDLEFNNKGLIALIKNNKHLITKNDIGWNVVSFGSLMDKAKKSNNIIAQNVMLKILNEDCI